MNLRGCFHQGTADQFNDCVQNNAISHIMGDESTVLPMDQAADNNDSETSEVVSCNSVVTEEGNNVNGEVSETSEVVSCNSIVTEEGNNVNGEVLLGVPWENKEDLEPPGSICDLGNNSSCISKSTASNEVSLELPISCDAPEESVFMVCETPPKNMFHPFAPSQVDAVCLAPKKKVNKGAKDISRRLLNFEGGDLPIKKLNFDLYGSEEEDLCFQAMQNMFAGVIISNEVIDVCGDHPTDDDDSTSESFKTPDSKPLLTGIADTCPGAPLRPSLKQLQLSPSICRKLDFDEASPKSLFFKDDKR